MPSIPTAVQIRGSFLALCIVDWKLNFFLQKGLAFILQRLVRAEIAFGSKKMELK